MSRWPLLSCVSACLLQVGLWPLGCAHAAEPDKDLFELSLEDLLKISVVTASGNAETAALAPASMTVFSRDDLSRMGVLWFDELMAYVPGGQSLHRVGIPQHYWTPILRGAPDRVGAGMIVLRDGVRVSGANLSAFTGLRRISLAQVDRVEIIRGPGASIYGANAIYGVINLLSANAPEQVSVGVGEFAARRFDARRRLAIGPGSLGVATNVYRDDGEEYRDIFDRNRRQTRSSDPLYLQEVELDWRQGPVVMGVAERHFRSENYIQLSLYNDDWNLGDNTEQRWYAQVRDLHWGPVRLTLNATHTDLTQQFRSMFVAQQAGTPFAAADWLADVTSTARNTIVSGHLHFQRGESIWSGGFEWEDIAADLRAISNYDLLTGRYLGAFTALPYSLQPNSQRQFHGLYGQWNRRWPTGFAATLGVRRDSYDDIGSATSPRVALSYEGLANHIGKFIYTEAFRAPSLQELYLSANPRALGNPDLQPVLLRNYELSWSYAGPRVSAEVSYYQSEERDRVVSVNLTPETSQRINAAQLDTRGIEWLGRWRVTPDWQLALVGRHIVGWDEDLSGAISEDRTADVMPKHLYTVSSDWQRGAWTLHGAVQYVEAVAALPDQPSYYLGRLALNWNPDSRQQLSLSVSNFADEAYAEATDTVGLGRDDQGRLIREAPQRGRQAMLSYRYRW